MDRLRELLGAFKAEETSKEDFKELVTTLVLIVLRVQEALNAGQTPDGLKISEIAADVEREQLVFQNSLETQEKEKQVVVMGQYGSEEFLLPGEDFNVVEEFADPEDGEEEEILNDVFQGQFGLKEFSSSNLDLPAKGTLASFVFINSLLENSRKGEG